MKKAILATALLALAACNQTETPAEVTDTDTAAASETGSMLEGEAPGFEAVAPGDYTVTRAGGEVDQVTIHPGMTYSRVAADGTATGGTIFMQDGKTCFVVEGVEGHNCFVDGPKQPDGSMETTSDAGTKATVRPATAAAAPATPAASAAGAATE